MSDAYRSQPAWLNIVCLDYDIPAELLPPCSPALRYSTGEGGLAFVRHVLVDQPGKGSKGFKTTFNFGAVVQRSDDEAAAQGVGLLLLAKYSPRSWVSMFRKASFDERFCSIKAQVTHDDILTTYTCHMSGKSMTGERTFSVSASPHAWVRAREPRASHQLDQMSWIAQAPPGQPLLTEHLVHPPWQKYDVHSWTSPSALSELFCTDTLDMRHFDSPRAVHFWKGPPPDSIPRGSRR